MNAVAKRAPVQPVQLFRPVPDVIPMRVRELMHTTWSTGPHRAALKRDAEQWLAAILPHGEPATQELVRAWLMPIYAVVINPRPVEAIEPFIAVLMIALDGVCAGAFTQATQRDLIRSCTHWPSAAEIYAVVAGPSAKIKMDIEALKRLIAAPTRPETAA